MLLTEEKLQGIEATCLAFELAAWDARASVSQLLTMVRKLQSDYDILIDMNNMERALRMQLQERVAALDQERKVIT